MKGIWNAMTKGTTPNWFVGGVLFILLSWEHMVHGVDLLIHDPLFWLFIFVGIIYVMVRMWQHIEKEVRNAKGP